MPPVAKRQSETNKKCKVRGVSVLHVSVGWEMFLSLSSEEQSP